MAEESPLVQIDHGSKSYGKRVILDDICLTIQRGDRLALLGPNGAGKSTLLRAIAGSTLLSKGKISLSCDSVLLLTSQMPMVGKWNAFESARYLAGTKDSGRVNHHFEQFGVLDFADSIVASYSLGMRQRLAFALAAIMRPDVILLDEALSGLDSEARLIVDQYLRSLPSAQALVVATHDRMAAMAVCDEVAVVEHGRLRERERRLDSYVVVVARESEVQDLTGNGLQAAKVYGRMFRVKSESSLTTLAAELASKSIEVDAIMQG